MVTVQFKVRYGFKGDGLLSSRSDFRNFSEAARFAAEWRRHGRKHLASLYRNGVLTSA